MSDCVSIRERFFAEPGLERGHPELEAHLAKCAACRQAAAALPLVDRALAEAVPRDLPVPSFERIAAAAAGAARARRRARLARRSLPFVFTGLSAAAAAALVVFVLHPPAASGPAPVAAGARLDSAAGARLATLGSGARFRVEAGAVEVSAAGGAEDRLLLESGRVALEVPKLPSGHAISVRTPDAEVRVHGTRFRVGRDERGTSVSVEEGVVEVRPAGAGRPPVFLRAGEATTVGTLASYRGELRAAALAALGRGELAAARARLESLLATGPAPEDGAEAQSLLAWAAAAGGDRRGAIERYRRALALLQADRTPLWAQNAAAELALLLEKEEPGAAKGAWRDYLARFPDGVHAGLARGRAGAAAEP